MTWKTGFTTSLSEDAGMSLRQIPPRERTTFLQRFALEHRGWLATLDRDGRIQARDEPLQTISTDAGIDIRLGGNSFHIPDADRVWLEEAASGGVERLQIDDAAGSILTLRFRATVPTDAVDGLAPAER
jgi:hypothetical protein